MLLSRRLRYQARRLRRTNFRPLLALVLVSLALDAFLAARRQPPAPPYRPHHLERVRARNESYFIVSVHRNTGAVLPAWNAAVLDLVEFLGRPNVFVSAVESGSQDDTKKHLCDLMEELDARHVPMEVRLGQTVWEQLAELYARPKERRPGWIWNRHDRQYDLRRIPYLSEVRNLAMAPLGRLAREGDVATGMPPRVFDKIVWINDVVFDTVDMAALLDTRGGDYAAACSVDFKFFPQYYDTFALRDAAGRKAASAYWPWFRPGPSRAAMLAGEPAPVFACWNGIVVFDAAPFYTAQELAATTGTGTGTGTDTIATTTRQGDGGQNQGQGLRFRGVPDSLADYHLEGSECCLVHADNALSAERGVWLNPNVRVGYSEQTYREIRRARGRFGWPAVVAGVWTQRWEGAYGAVREWLEARTVRTRLARWMAAAPGEGEAERYEPGAPCLINEMQIMWENGWRHL